MIDVARLAGVSQTAVSFVINDAPLAAKIPAETRERIRSAIRTLGYRPNAAAKLLRTRASHTIGFITDESATSANSGDMIAGAQSVAWKHGKVLIIVNTGGDDTMAEAGVDMMLERRVDGLIYAADYHHLVDLPPALAEVSSVLLDCYCADRSFPSVVPDEVGGGRVGTGFLLRKGHQRIGLISVPRHIPAGPGRLAGYQQAHVDHGVPYDSALVRHSNNSTADDGYTCAHELLALTEPPTALFCATDRIAMGAYDAIKERGYRIPQDVAVLGFDDQQIISCYLRPTLTTVALPHRSMGEWAVRYLLDDAELALEAAPVQHLMPCTLIERNSA